MQLLLPLVLLLVATQEPIRTAAEVRHMIRHLGATRAHGELDRNGGGWISVLSGVASADEAWLDVAVRLYPASDGGGAEDLSKALQDALVRNTTAVLKRIEQHHIAAGVACGSGSGLVDAPPATVLAAFDRRIALVTHVRSGVRRSTLDACLTSLQDGRQRIEDAYHP